MPRPQSPAFFASLSFLHAARSGDATAFLAAWPESPGPSVTQVAAALCAAARRGHEEVVYLIVHRAGFLMRHRAGELRPALVAAAEAGHERIVRELVNLEDPNGKALIAAAEGGHLEIARLLLRVSDPGVEDARPLRAAAEKGFVDLVALLLPLSGHRGPGLALKEACNHERLPVIAFVAPRATPLEVDNALGIATLANRASTVACLLAARPTEKGIVDALVAAVLPVFRPASLACLVEHASHVAIDRAFDVCLQKSNRVLADRLSPYASLERLRALQESQLEWLPSARGRLTASCLESCLPPPPPVLLGRPRL